MESDSVLKSNEVESTKEAVMSQQENANQRRLELVQSLSWVISWHNKVIYVVVKSVFVIADQCRQWSGAFCTRTLYIKCLLIKARFPLPEFTGRVDGPWTRVHFLTPELMARVNDVNSGRQLGCQKLHPSSRTVNSASELRPSTRVVDTGLKCHVHLCQHLCVTLTRYSMNCQ